MSKLNVVDSSAWLEYLTESPSAAQFATAIEDVANLVVPVITVYEVFKKILCERNESDALQVASLMQSGEVVDLDLTIAMDAAHLKLPLADSIIYATAKSRGATLWTQDEHFKDLPGVKYFEKV